MTMIPCLAVEWEGPVTKVVALATKHGWVRNFECGRSAVNDGLYFDIPLTQTPATNPDDLSWLHGDPDTWPELEEDGVYVAVVGL